MKPLMSIPNLWALMENIPNRPDHSAIVLLLGECVKLYALALSTMIRPDHEYIHLIPTIPPHALEPGVPPYRILEYIDSVHEWLVADGLRVDGVTDWDQLNFAAGYLARFIRIDS